MDSRVSILGELSVECFHRDYWQTQPLLVRDAPWDRQLGIDKKGLLKLARKDDVESRLVLFDVRSQRWSCEFGPHTSRRLRSLTDSHWTLLVQALDQWEPRVGTLLEAFDFLPSWRLDDVMISYASEGGGVGPHFDHYDVFLMQLEGSRVWEIGERCDDLTPLQEHDTLKLLSHFEPRQRWVVGPGDILYLPPGIAHCGTALSNDCITCSVGFRSPGYGELLSEAGALLGESRSPSERFRDTLESLCSPPYQINEQVVSTLERFIDTLDRNQLCEALVHAFGRQVTEPRYPDLIFPKDECSVAGLLEDLAEEGGLRLRHHPSSRFAYRLVSSAAQLYVDGERFFTSRRVAEAVCAGVLSSTDIGKVEDAELIVSLVNRGSLMLEPPKISR